MGDTICIPKERYDFLIKCEKLVDSEFKENYSEKFVREVKESQAAYEKGNYIAVKDRKDREKLFDSL